MLAYVQGATSFMSVRISLSFLSPSTTSKAPGGFLKMIRICFHLKTININNILTINLPCRKTKQPQLDLI